MRGRGEGSSFGDGAGADDLFITVSSTQGEGTAECVSLLGRMALSFPTDDKWKGSKGRHRRRDAGRGPIHAHTATGPRCGRWEEGDARRVDRAERSGFHLQLDTPAACHWPRGDQTPLGPGKGPAGTPVRCNNSAFPALPARKPVRDAQVLTSALARGLLCPPRLRWPSWLACRCFRQPFPLDALDALLSYTVVRSCPADPRRLQDAKPARRIGGSRDRRFDVGGWMAGREAIPAFPVVVSELGKLTEAGYL